MSTVTMETWHVAIAGGVTLGLSISVIVMCYVTRKRAQNSVGAHGHHLPGDIFQKNGATHTTPALPGPHTPSGPLGPAAPWLGQGAPQLSPTAHSTHPALQQQQSPAGPEGYPPQTPPYPVQQAPYDAENPAAEASTLSHPQTRLPVLQEPGGESPALAGSSSDARRLSYDRMSDSGSKAGQDDVYHTPLTQPEDPSSPSSARGTPPPAIDAVTYNYRNMTEDDSHAGALEVKNAVGLLHSQRVAQRMGVSSPVAAEVTAINMTKATPQDEVGITFESGRPVVALVDTDSIADKAGVTKGTRFVAVNGVKVFTAEEAVKEVAKSRWEVAVLAATQKARRVHGSGEGGFSATAPTVAPRSWGAKGRGVSSGSTSVSHWSDISSSPRAMRQSTSMSARSRVAGLPGSTKQQRRPGISTAH